MSRLLRTAEEILAEIAAQGGDEPDTEPTPDTRTPRRQHETYAVRGVIDIDAGVGRLLAGWDNIHRHAKVWIDEVPPPEEPVPSPLRKGCPSEGQYRRHLKAGEKCQPCRELVHELEKVRRAKWGGRR